MKKLSLTGTIQKGSLMFSTFARNQMTDFLRGYNGHSVIVELTITEENASIVYQVYFDRVVVPEFMRGLKETGLHLAKSETVRFIEQNSPVCENRKVNNLCTRELTELIDWCVIYGAENLNLKLQKP